ncbi:BRCT domain-containing protein [Tundrisphaera lichenicola]|uniref:BRCT domain-containing protein n=1 Tax=Tundrisphaera lichenicola TaxID=2029860 RepID=UPI003EBF9B93
MPTRLRLDDVRRAWDSKDPDLVGFVEALANQDEETPESPVREGALTFEKFLAEIRSRPFFKRTLDEQRHYRVEQLKALESPEAEIPLPDRLRLHEIVLALWEDNGPYARSNLLTIIAKVPLRYGPWRALKRIFKEAEARDDSEIYGALAARIDAAYGRSHPSAEVGSLTLSYIRRRAWRHLREIARTRPACYADAAADVLAHYPESTGWNQTLVANHIFFHETGEYDRSSFRSYRIPSDLLKYRAFADLWKRSPRPLFGLLERARSDRVREFAAKALQADFRASLREVEPDWVARLIGVGSGPVDEFAVWILKNVPRFEQAGFRDLGLHDAVLRLFDSPSHEARAYAAEYARTHARDLPVDELIRLINNDQGAVSRLASDLLQARDPRQEVGLDAWGRLLETRNGHTLATSVLRKHYSPRDLTPEWFQDRLFTRIWDSSVRIQSLLLQTHPAASLGPVYFVGLIEASDRQEGWSAGWVAEFAMGHLAKFDLNALDADFLRRLILRPATRGTTAGWIDEGRLKPQGLGLDFLRALAFHPDWEADPSITALRREGPAWARDLTFDESLSERVLGWLRDVRRFNPGELGFEWLLKLASRGEPRYHNFAVDTMIKGFSPADFAPKEEAAPADTPGEVDLGGASFLFTGKMATMQRKEAEDNVRRLGGAVASGVTNKLHYLVIGDEGSSLYGHGKKGSKQVKGEELNAAGANIKIISETAFLKMLAGQTTRASAGSSLDGASRLWEMANAPGQPDAPLAQFAIKYIRRHHPDIALAETDRPVDPGSEIRAEFLTFERVEPLFRETRKPLRDLALELARWEFARWSPPAEDLVRLAENPHAAVRQFLAESLLADDAPEHRRYRIDPEALGAAAVFRFCESGDESTRALGLRLIGRSPRFRLPEELFRLTESPDRRVRAHVIRILWSLYRDRGITEDWKPYIPPTSTIGAAAAKKALARAEVLGTGPPIRPENPPASPGDLWSMLRRTLFEIPPARPEKRAEGAEEAGERLKQMPARQAKLALIETWRDLAIEDVGFARGVLPLMEEFMSSRGRSERDACLVAVTRLRHAHPELRLVPKGGDS